MDNRLKKLWELENWPNFSWHIEELKPKLDNIRLLQGRMLGKLDDLPASFAHQAQVDILVENVMRNRGVNEHFITMESFLASAGCAVTNQPQRSTMNKEPIASLLNLWLIITQNYHTPLSLLQLSQWHGALFAEECDESLNPFAMIVPEQSAVPEFQQNAKRRFAYETPPQVTKKLELLGFLQWFNHKPEGLDGLLRAGIAHLWFLALQPYEKGNGRMARVISDLALAQTESLSIRYYSLSSTINANRALYGDYLGRALNGDLDITQWLSDFLSMLEDAIMLGISRINHFMRKTRYWQKHSQTILNARQLKLLNTLLDAKENDVEDAANIYASKYMNITNVSKATATRELADLVQKNCLKKLPGGGRSTRYVIA